MISIRQKSKFFDRKAVTDKIGKAQSRLLSRAGAFTRRAARQSMKKAPKRPKTNYGEYYRVQRGKNAGELRFRRGEYAQPGKPPNARSSEPNLRTVLFAFDGKDRVVVGSVQFNARSRQNRPAPNVMEFGGVVHARTGSILRRRRLVTRNYRARPYMGPAGTKAAKDLEKKLKNSAT